MGTGAYAAVDLGASSGRVMVGVVDRTTITLTEVHRFANEPVALPDGLHWDILDLYRQMLSGLRAAGPVASIGIDSWAIDYGLLDGDGALLGNPYHYRDPRTDSVVSPVDAARLYDVTGIAYLPFNTVFQLLAERGGARLDRAETLLLVPDLLAYWLTGRIGAERTNASTTGLYDARTGEWSDALVAEAGLRREIFPDLRGPGETIGALLPRTGLDGTLVAVGSHDTASAVAAVPADGPRFAYISSGTWSLVGVELDRPVLTEASRAANFTNEAGLDGTVRYLRNVMGLWLLQECQRVWRSRQVAAETADLIAAAGSATPFAALVNPDHPDFLAPGDMPARIADHCATNGSRAPATPGEYTRCVIESLAVAHRAAVRDAVRLSGRDVDVVHLVGGGAHNALLCQLTADACGRPVVAGPVEATALGNVLVQARETADLAAMRALVRASQPLRRFTPRDDTAGAWDKAAARVGLG